MTEFKRNRVEIAALWLVMALISCVAVFICGVAFIVITSGEGGYGAVMALVGAVMAGLVVHLIDEALARGGVRIGLDAEHVHLKLPGRRGFVRLAPVRESIALAAIASVETRTEAFRQLGSSAVQHPYALRLSDGRVIVLGADRPMLAPYFGPAATAIAAQARAPMHNLGVIDGHPGFLLITGASIPPWDAPALPQAEGERRVTQAQTFLRWAYTIALAALAIAALARMADG